MQGLKKSKVSLSATSKTPCSKASVKKEEPTLVQLIQAMEEIVESGA